MDIERFYRMRVYERDEKKTTLTYCGVSRKISIRRDTYKDKHDSGLDESCLDHYIR
jgi:hypothetical protein